MPPSTLPSSDEPAVSTSGIATVQADDGSGEKRVIPASRRADGSLRKERAVRPGYTPPEDVARYRRPGPRAVPPVEIRSAPVSPASSRTHAVQTTSSPAAGSQSNVPREDNNTGRTTGLLSDTGRPSSERERSIPAPPMVHQVRPGGTLASSALRAALFGNRSPALGNASRPSSPSTERTLSSSAWSATKGQLNKERGPAASPSQSTSRPPSDQVIGSQAALSTVVPSYTYRRSSSDQTRTRAYSHSPQADRSGRAPWPSTPTKSGRKKIGRGAGASATAGSWRSKPLDGDNDVEAVQDLTSAISSLQM